MAGDVHAKPLIGTRTPLCSPANLPIDGPPYRSNETAHQASAATSAEAGIVMTQA
jgi:hypothetical protein